MNKNYILSVGAMMALSFGAAAVTVPYSSEIGASGNTIDPDWAIENAGARGSKSFTFDNLGRLNYAEYGFTYGIVHYYDSEYAANCWAMSPFITLEAGKEYTVSFHAATNGADFEKYELRYSNAGGRTAAILSQGTQLLKNDFYSSALALKKQSATFTATESGEYCFGIHCYSDANAYEFYVTGFSIVEGNGEGGGTVEPPVAGEGLQLPYNCAFETSEVFNSWTSVAGPAAESKSPWSYNSYSKWAEFDKAQNVKEDNWFISPEVYFPSAGSYVAEVRTTIYGSLDFALVKGVDQASLDAAEVLESVKNESLFDVDREIRFTITEPGAYRFAAHANADAGTYMGYRLNSVKLKADVPVPALITDLKATPDANDGLSVALTWTNPANDQKGEPITSLVKVELMRGDEVIYTDNNPVAGSAGSYTDNVPAAGCYTYTVKAYNVNGCIDIDPVPAASGYVGRPEAQMPYSIDINSADIAEIEKFSILDANGDGSSWYYDNSSSWSKMMKSKVEVGAIADDYIATPYLTLEKGYYRVDTNVSARYNSYEVGVATNRHDIAGTYTKLAEYLDVEEYGATNKVNYFEAETAGDYLVVIRHIGMAGNTYYSEVSFDKLTVTPQSVLPGHVTDLKAAEGDNASVVLSWTNPSVDVIGNDLDDIEALGYTITRDGVAILTVAPAADCRPGQNMEFIDTEVAQGNHTYTVTACNSNGDAAGEAPVISIYNGAAAEIPYTATDFSDWQTVNGGYYWCEWEVVDNTLVYDGYYVDPDYAFTPYLNFQPNSDYVVRYSVLADPDSEEIRLGVVTAGSPEAASARRIAEAVITEDSEIEVYLTTREIATQTDETVLPVYIDAGKQLIGFVPNTAGKHTITAFHIEATTPTGVETVIAAENGITYSEGMVYFPAAARDIVICDTAGRVLYSANSAAAPIRINARGIVIISANIDGRAASLKVRR